MDDRGKITSKELRSRLDIKSNPDTVRKYLKILEELALVKIDSSREYRGIAKAKKFYEITAKGRELVSSTASILS